MLHFFAFFGYCITDFNLNLFYYSADCQSKLRLLGGLRALINQLKEHVEQEELADQNISFLEHIVNTIGSAIAGHGMPYTVNSNPYQDKYETSVMK